VGRPFRSGIYDHGHPKCHFGFAENSSFLTGIPVRNDIPVGLQRDSLSTSRIFVIPVRVESARRTASTLTILKGRIPMLCDAFYFCGSFTSVTPRKKARHKPRPIEQQDSNKCLRYAIPAATFFPPNGGVFGAVQHL
jgi:hypothetical protein